MVQETGGQPSAPGRRPSPLLDRILRQRDRPFTEGMSILLGLPGEAPATPPPPPPSPPEVAPPPAPAAAEAVEPSRLNHGALLNRLRGTHQANLTAGFYALLNSAVPAAVQAMATPEVAEASAYRAVMLDANSIGPNPYLPRAPEDPEALELLVQSIREQGILEPLLVHPAPEGASGSGPSYWIISGERRRQAAIRAGMDQVPAIVKDVAPRTGLQIFLSQNLHTHQPSMLDHAHVLQVLTKEMGMTPMQVASRIGAVAEDIDAVLAVLALEEAMQESMREGRLSFAQAGVLLEASDEEVRRDLWEYAVRYRASAERMRNRLERILAGETGLYPHQP